LPALRRSFGTLAECQQAWHANGTRVLVPARSELKRDAAMAARGSTGLVLLTVMVSNRTRAAPLDGCTMYSPHRSDPNSGAVQV
jgi:hypothetical protein